MNAHTNRRCYVLHLDGQQRPTSPVRSLLRRALLFTALCYSAQVTASACIRPRCDKGKSISKQPFDPFAPARSLVCVHCAARTLLPSATIDQQLSPRHNKQVARSIHFLPQHEPSQERSNSSKVHPKRRRLAHFFSLDRVVPYNLQVAALPRVFASLVDLSTSCEGPRWSSVALTLYAHPHFVAAPSTTR